MTNGPLGSAVACGGLWVYSEICFRAWDNAIRARPKDCPSGVAGDAARIRETALVRVNFTPDDVARTRFTVAPAPLVETALALVGTAARGARARPRRHQLLGDRGAAGLSRDRAPAARPARPAPAVAGFLRLGRPRHRAGARGGAGHALDRPARGSELRLGRTARAGRRPGSATWRRRPRVGRPRGPGAARSAQGRRRAALGQRAGRVPRRRGQADTGARGGRPRGAVRHAAPAAALAGRRAGPGGHQHGVRSARRRPGADTVRLLDRGAAVQRVR